MDNREDAMESKTRAFFLSAFQGCVIGIGTRADVVRSMICIRKGYATIVDEQNVGHFIYLYYIKIKRVKYNGPS